MTVDTEPSPVNAPSGQQPDGSLAAAPAPPVASGVAQSPTEPQPPEAAESPSQSAASPASSPEPPVASPEQPSPSPSPSPETSFPPMAPLQPQDSSPSGQQTGPPADNPYYTLAKKRMFPLRPSTPVYENGTAYTREPTSPGRPGEASPVPQGTPSPPMSGEEGDMSLLAFRMQFIVAGPGLIPWAYDVPFLAGMNDYLGPDSGVGNLTIRNWAEVNLANFPEVPALLSLPQNGLGSPVWIIMTGTTTQLRGYNRLISKIVPLTAASRSADLIPFMVADGLNVTRVFLYNLDYGPSTQLPPAVPSAPPSVQSRQVPPPDRRPPSAGVTSAVAPAPAAGSAPAAASAASQSDSKTNVGMIGGVVAAGVVGIIAAAAFLFLFARTRRRNATHLLALHSSGLSPAKSGPSEGHAHSRSFDWAGRLWGPPSPGPPTGGSPNNPRGKALAQARSSALSARRSEPWAIDPAEIHVMQQADGQPWVLGEGASGSVYKATWRVQTVAVKMLTHTTEKQMDAFKREAFILEDLKDANIVQFMGACFDEGNTMLVTEFMAGGNLFDAIGNDRSGKLGWYHRGRKIAMDVARGLDKMHSRHIIHLDLKSPNVLLTAGGTAKIADVGLSKILVNESTMMTNFQGTFEWAPPELINGGECSEKADIYSFGVILWEIVTAERPFRKQFRAPRAPEECPADIAALIRDCLSPEPEARPSSTVTFHILQQQAALAPKVSTPEATPRDSADVSAHLREDASTSAHAADAAAPVFPAVPPAVLAHGPGAVMETVALPPRPSTPVGERGPPGLPKSPSRALPGPPTSDVPSIPTVSGNGLPRRPSAATTSTTTTPQEAEGFIGRQSGRLEPSATSWLPSGAASTSAPGQQLPSSSGREKRLRLSFTMRIVV
ncbi:hypothetical protein WJX75_004665 [Coccomyxa subellipsoidea]|uniref:Protein kinase domain-containing protein n=1 Tax=Coccomyxa subellipsoidea TaxID=248742 RepID=A0ABR2YGB0_9CHLO